MHKSVYLTIFYPAIIFKSRSRVGFFQKFFSTTIIFRSDFATKLLVYIHPYSVLKQSLIINPTLGSHQMYFDDYCPISV